MTVPQKPVAVLDACVLYPGLLRGLLVLLTKESLFHARWTDQIHDEWISALLRDRPYLDPERLAWDRARIDGDVEGGLISGFEHWIRSVKLPDPDDRHVVAAAIHVNAIWIVTFNLRDFPAENLLQWNLKAIHPDKFMLLLLQLSPEKTISIIAKHRRSLTRPPGNREEYLDMLEKQGLALTVQALRKRGVAL